MKVAIASLVFLFSIIAAHAEIDSSYCFRVIETALREYKIRLYSRTVTDAIYDRYCKANSARGNFSSGGKATFPIQGIPTEYGGNLSGGAEKIENFCKNYQRAAMDASSSIGYDEVISSRALDSFDQCVTLASKSIKIWPEFLSDDLLSIYIEASVASPVAIRGLAIRNMKCTAFIDGREVDWSDFRGDIKDSTNIHCERKPNPQVNSNLGSISLPRASLVADIRGTPFHVMWPESNREPLTNEQLEAELKEQKAELNLLKNQLQETIKKLDSEFAKFASTNGSDYNVPDNINNQTALDLRPTQCPKGQFPYRFGLVKGSTYGLL
jgi:hypothetical protein